MDRLFDERDRDRRVERLGEGVRHDRRPAQQLCNQGHRPSGVLLQSAQQRQPRAGQRQATARDSNGIRPRECDIRWSSYILPDLPRLERLYPHFCIVQVNNVFNMPQRLGDTRWVAYPHPQVVFQYYDGRTGELDYAEAVSVAR
jgi:hypothetical protein